MQRVVAFCVVLALAGCGAAHRSAHRAPPLLGQAQATHEYRSKPPPTQRTAGAAVSPAAAVAGFATAYINWNAQTVPGVMRRLAARSVGPARAAMQLAAAQTTGDYELKRGGVANQGVVEAVAPLHGGGDQYIVVTRELTTATASTTYQGLQPAWHVALATVTQVRGGWVVSGWEPQS